MKKEIIVVAAALLLHAGLQAPAQSNVPPPIVLSPAIPGDVNVTAHTVSIEAFQPDFDVYSWNTFIALNWPAGPDGNGNPKQTIGQNGDNETVWEHYRDVSEVFLPGGKRPTWNGPPRTVPPEGRKLYKPGMRVLTQVGKTPTVLTDFSQPFNTGPIIDQKAGQKVFTPPVKFACGTLARTESPASKGPSWSSRRGR